MKMKTKLIGILLVTVLLASCGGKGNGTHEIYREISDFSNICLTDTVAGEFYYEYDSFEATHFLDYTTMGDTLLCSKPNCPHTPSYTHDDPECSAYNLGHKPCLYGNNLYFMTDNMERNNTGFVPYINMKRADIDGSNRKITAKLEGYKTSGDTDYLVGDKLYFTANKEKESYLMEMKNGNTYYRKMGIWCYDFVSDTFELIYDRYNNGHSVISLVGYWQGKLYFSRSEIDEEDYIQSGYYAMDLESKEVTEAENGFVAVSDEYLITLENDTYILHKDEDTRIAAEGFEYEQYLSVYIINGKMFSQNRDYCFDTDTGKCRKITVPKGVYVRAYLDGCYILQDFDFEAQKPLYSKVPEDELIGDIIS